MNYRRTRQSARRSPTARYVFLVMLFSVWSLLPSENLLASDEGTLASANPPARVKPVRGEKLICYGKPDGKPFSLQVFVFNPDSMAARPAIGAFTITTESSPVPETMGLGSNFQSSICPLYGNSVWDLSEFPTISLGYLRSTTGLDLSDIKLSRGNSNELFVSSDYVVFPGQLRRVPRSGPFATVTFDWHSSKKPISPDARLVLRRKGRLVKDVAIDTTKTIDIELDRVRATGDVVDWTVTDGTGSVTHRGTVAFPVTGAAPGLVVYAITISEAK